MTAAANQSGRRPTTSRRLERAGIRDVAAAAGVSITTVSDALNGKGRLPDETRSRVREVAERLGYRPSAAARTLRTGRSGLIGLTVTTYGEEPFTFTEFAYFAEMARAATSAALGRGYALVVLPASSRHDVWGNIALDGTVVIDPPDQDPLVSELYRSGVPVVSDGKPGNCPVTAWVDNDHEAAVLGILDHLSEAGARRIGLLTGTSTDTYTRLSTEAYLGWCTKVGQEPVYEAYPAHDPATALAGCSPAPTGRTPCTACSTPTAPICWPPPAATACGCRTTCCWSAAARATSTRPPSRRSPRCRSSRARSAQPW